MEENPLHSSMRDTEASTGSVKAGESESSAIRGSVKEDYSRRQRQKSVVDEMVSAISVEGMNEIDDLGETENAHIMGAGQKRPLIFDGVSKSINPRIFVTQFIIQMFPFLVWPFQCLMREKFYPMGFELWKVSKEEKENPRVFYTALVLGNYLCPGAFLTICITSCLFDSVQFRLKVVSGMTLVPMLFMTLHRLTVSLKYATLNGSEYDRFMSITKGFVQASIYQKQLQLLSAWSVKRTNLLLRFELEAAAARTGMSTTDDVFFIPAPSCSKYSLYEFKQWQAFLCLTHDLGQFDGTVHPLVKDILVEHHDESGLLQGYKVSVPIVAQKILEWVDVSSTLVVNKYKNINKLVLFGIIATPIVRLAFVVEELKQGSAKDICLFILLNFCCLVLSLMGYSVLGFFVAMMTDTARRGLIAAILKDMIRPHEVLTDGETTRISHEKIARRMLAKMSEIKLKYNGDNVAPCPITMTELIIDTRMDKPVSEDQKEKWLQDRPSLVNDMRDWDVNKDRSSCQYLNAKLGYDLTDNDADDKQTDYFSDEIQRQFVDDLRYNIPDPSRFMGRVPNLDVTQYARMNILSWISLRTTFRSFGDRFKLRMDGMSVFLFVTFITILILIACAQIMEPNGQEELEVDDGSSSHEKFYTLVDPTSAFVIQSILAATAVIFLLLGNVAEAASTNDKYEGHIHTVQLHVMKTESEIAWIDMILRKNNVNVSLDDDSDDDSVGDTKGDADGAHLDVVSCLDQIPAAGQQSPQRESAGSNRNSCKDRSTSTVVDMKEILDNDKASLMMTETGAISSTFESDAFRQHRYNDIERIAQMDYTILVERKRYLTEFRKTLRSAASNVEGTDRDRPVSIMGITASWTLYCSILTGLMSLAVTIASQFSRNSSSNSSVI